MTTLPILTYAEQVTLLDTLLIEKGSIVKEAKGVRNYCMALLMLDAGLRVSEVTHLRVKDLWFHSEPVTSIIISPEIAKTNTERKIPISERLHNAIKLMPRRYWSHYQLAVNDFAFAMHQKSKPPTTRQVENIIKAAGRKAFNRDIHPHMLRHTFATRLMNKTSIRVVQELLGHKSLSSTQVYTHPNDLDLKKAIEQINPRKELE